MFIMFFVGLIKYDVKVIEVLRIWKMFLEWGRIFLNSR